MPPGLIAETLLARSMFAFPALEGLVCSPTLRPDGSLLVQPGYDPNTGLYLHGNGTTFPSIPAHPGLQHARDALVALKEPLVDFLFAADCHRSAALAAMLSLVCRVAIQGYVPLFAIRANTRGSGKSLLADVISLIGTGRPAPHWPQVTDEEEERKRILTIAMAGYPVVHINWLRVLQIPLTSCRI